MNGDPLLNQSIQYLKEDLEETRKELKITSLSVTNLDKHLAVLRAEVEARARKHAGWVAFLTTVGIQLLERLFDSPGS